jgi:histidinol dehydrogenase
MTTAVSSSAPTQALEIRYVKAAAALTAAERRALFDRSTRGDSAGATSTAAIIAAVRDRGDDALRELGRRYDSVELASLEVPRAAIRNALDALDPDVRRAMERSARNIDSVHRASLPQAMEMSPEPGVVVGRRPDPLGRVGVYAPGGRAAYPSSVLMGAVPARVAGVGEVILCSPPDRSGKPSAIVLAAAELAAVDRVFAIGGAGAIAAMALGTESVPRVDKIVGPGNAYVAEAKLQLVGNVAIDSPAGPSELLVIADSSASPDVVATEMLAQAEHDPLACVIAVCVGAATASLVAQSLGRLIASMPRADVIAASLHGQGAVVSVDSIDEALAFATEYAPEHLLLAVRDAGAIAAKVRNAGTIFIDECSSVAFGDYLTGANHVLPTGGMARAYSGLSVLDFFRWTTYQRIDSAAAGRLASDTAIFAAAEGLPGHAAAARQWSVSR